jgi:benzoyl-CoA reductase/2-hydroxyglutaryl-CoA dehydratase subunit BcrC/BadD/HgdB
MSNAEVIGSSTERIHRQSQKGGTIIGYLYPHTPIELFLAHGLIPSLIHVNPTAKAGFEDSLQTFSCAFTRNIFSQRASGAFQDLSGFLFPGNSCDALQNVGDVWRQRFGKDIVLRLTYPIESYSDASVKFFAAELKLLSDKLQKLYGRPFSSNDFSQGAITVNNFRKSAQLLYAARLIDPTLISYSDLIALIHDFLGTPDSRAEGELVTRTSSVSATLEKRGLLDFAEQIRLALLSQNLATIMSDNMYEGKRLLLVGGMVDPQAIPSLMNTLEGYTSDIIGLDLLSFAFKTVFTPPIRTDQEPFVAMASSILQAPLEPTQEGLPRRLAFLKQLLEVLRFDGMVVCEQSFCDPDEFETPSVLKASEEVGIPSLRLPIDPELSDKGRVEVRLQSFLETIGEVH